MPVYDYKCQVCGYKIEDYKQKINDEKLKICPKCNKKSLIRLIGNSSFHLKGSGWCDSILQNAGR